MSSVTESQGGAAGTGRIAIVMQPGRDRKLLGEWLSTLPGYTVELHTTPPDDPPADLYLLDQSAVTEHRGALERIKESVNPVFLPYLLLLPADTTGADDRRWEERLETDIINDTAKQPVTEGVLTRRIENLLNARRASLRLRERDGQYEQLVELTPEAILLLDGETVRYANTAATELFRSRVNGDLRNQNLLDVVGSQGGATLRQIVDTVQAEGSLDGVVDVELEGPDDTTVYAEVSGVRVRFDQRPLTQLVLRDVTGEKHRLQRLDLFGRAIEASAQGITIADVQQEDDPLVYANEAFERITGYSAGEIIGRNCRFLQGERTDPTAVRRFRRALDAREPVSVELLNYRKDGTPFWNRVDLVPVDSADGTITHYLGLQRDVTERKQRTERIAVMDRVLRHNLRNRLNVIRGYAEQLPAGVTVDGEPVGDRIATAADDLITLSEQIREFRSVVSGDE